MIYTTTIPQENIKIHMSDGNMIKTVRVERSQTAWDLCLCMVLKNDLPICGNWTLVERIVSNGCGKSCVFKSGCGFSRVRSLFLIVQDFHC